MILIVCVDNRLKTSFFGKRQSKDRAVRRDILSMADGAPVRMSDYTRKQFEEDGCLVASEDFLSAAKPGEYCFAEGDFTFPDPSLTETLVLYKWNRDYPGNNEIPTDYLSHFTLTQSYDFDGVSHERITKEVYKK